MINLFWAVLSLFIMVGTVTMIVFTLWDPIFIVNDAVQTASNSYSNQSDAGLGQPTVNVSQAVQRVRQRDEWTVLAVPVIFIGGAFFWFMVYSMRLELGRF